MWSCGNLSILLFIVLFLFFETRVSRLVHMARDASLTEYAIPTDAQQYLIRFLFTQTRFDG